MKVYGMGNHAEDQVKKVYIRVLYKIDKLENAIKRWFDI